MPSPRELLTAGHGIDAGVLPAFDIENPRAARVDPRQWFDEPARPLEIEIGCGKGTFLVQQGEIAPLVNYLGVEQARAFYRHAADRARRRALANVRILHADAAEFVRYRCPDAVARVIHLYFSDPWPKRRHHKRRVVQTRSLADFHRVLEPGGQLRLVTDHDELWAWYEDLAAQCAHLFDRRAFAAAESAQPGEWVGSNYERKFAREGRPFHAMTLVRGRGGHETE